MTTPAAVLARRLLGCTLVRALTDGPVMRGLIVETEAYLGVEDAASHAFGGRRTKRNESMYARAGTAYVYFTYGMHHCFNVVCGRAGEPAAVLIRALEPLEGIERMRAACPAAASDELATHRLLAGPGKLCRAMQIDRTLDGVDLVKSTTLYIEREAGPIDAETIVAAPRIGIADRGDWTHAPLRFLIAHSPSISVKKAVTARARGQTSANHSAANAVGRAKASSKSKT